MAWERNDLPEQSGTCLVSILWELGFGTSVFLYVAYFNAETKRWHQYDPFKLKGSIGDEVEGRVVAWDTDIAVWFN